MQGEGTIPNGSIDEEKEQDDRFTSEEITEIKIKKSKKPKQPTLESPSKHCELGPGQYDPSLDYVRKQAPSYNWAASKTVREVKDKKKDHPGPESYN
jgi:hypothetical protein